MYRALMVGAAFSLSMLAVHASQPTTVDIAPGVHMPMVNLGTCCGSDPSVGVKPWLAAGGVGIDTAWSYRDQAAIATALKGTDRSKYFMTTKVPPGNASATPADAIAKLKYDLAQLGEDHVDLVLIHHPCEAACNAALWKGLEEALAQGLTKAIGVSNFSPDDLTALLKTAKVPPAVNQCHMSIKAHDPERLSFCKAHNITYEAFDAMKGCDFTSPVIKKVAAAHSVGVAQVCLKWVLQTGAVIAVGTGSDASKVAEYSKEDLDLFSFELTAAEMDTLNKIGSPPAPTLSAAAAPTASFEAPNLVGYSNSSLPGGSNFWFPSISIPTGIKGHVAQHITLSGDGGTCPPKPPLSPYCEQVCLTSTFSLATHFLIQI